MIRAACLLAAFGFCLFTATALAQEPPREDGVGPYRFGMSIEEARATAPNAAWTSEPQDDSEVLTGGPEVALGGAMTPALVFVGGALKRIVLAGVTQHSCPDAAAAMVNALEPRYGAFGSLLPYPWEQGRLTSTVRTAAGSEIRVREIDERGVTASSARYGAMYLLVLGRPQVEGEVEHCRVTLMLGPQADWPRSDSGAGPAWTELDQAESLTDPIWTARPSARRFARFFPHEALIRGVDGLAVLDCLVVDGGRVSCRVSGEGPNGWGFGAAALRIAEDFRVSQGGDGTPAAGRRIRVPIRFHVG
jgi:hypothetical protein